MWEGEGEGERQWCGGCSRMNERRQEKDHKRASQHISHPEAGKASRLAPNGKIHLAWKELRQLRFSQTSGRLSERRSRQSPAMWCWKNARKQWETENRRLPALFGKVETRKSGNSCKKKKKRKISYVQKYRLKVQLQCREEIWKEAETWRRETGTYFVMLRQIAIITNIHPLRPEHSYMSSEMVFLLPASPSQSSLSSLGLCKRTGKGEGGSGGQSGRRDEEHSEQLRQKLLRCCYCAGWFMTLLF